MALDVYWLDFDENYPLDGWEFKTKEKTLDHEEEILKVLIEIGSAENIT